MRPRPFDTSFTRLLGCDLPIQQAAMGGVTTSELAAAVSGAGGLGMLHHTMRPSLPQAIAKLVELAPGRPFGVGFFGFLLDADRENLELAADRADVVEVFWEEPTTERAETIHNGGALAIWQVGSSEEALAAEAAGCDAVVVQGVEAGGHVRGTTPLIDLLEQTAPRLEVPVVAAGGIVDGRSMATAMKAGADAVRMGTRFVATSESAAHPDYIAALVAAGKDDTALTTAFEVGWPDAPHRVLRSALDSANAFEGDFVASGEDGDDRWDVVHFSPEPPTRWTSGELGATAMYAGAAVELIDDVPSAVEVVERTAAEAQDELA